MRYAGNVRIPIICATKGNVSTGKPGFLEWVQLERMKVKKAGPNETLPRRILPKDGGRGV